MYSQEFFLDIVRLGVGLKIYQQPLNNVVSSKIDWQVIETLAVEQGLTAIVEDGVEKLPEEQKPLKPVLLQWIGETLQSENQSTIQQKAASEMAQLFHHNAIRTYVLKGAVVAECYPNPLHRSSVDMDCFLLPESSDFDAWSFGNDLIKALGFEVNFDYYKNSTFLLPGLTVENHKFMTPFRGNKKIATLEIILQGMLKEDDGIDRFVDTWLYRPPVMVTALFLIEHAYSHFLHEGLTWRHVLDWMMFSKKHNKEIDWYSLGAMIDEFGFRRFYNSYLQLGKFLLGDISEEDLSRVDKKMLDDVWAPLDLPESVHGIKGKLSMVRSTWRARWKYKHFGDISMLHDLWNQTKGVLFLKNPKLG